MTLFIERDWPVKEAKCEYYCWPSCHPMQVGPEHVYGCKHPKVWDGRGFVPIVECGGDPESDECWLRKRG